MSKIFLDYNAQSDKQMKANKLQDYQFSKFTFHH